MNHNLFNNIKNIFNHQDESDSSKLDGIISKEAASSGQATAPAKPVVHDYTLERDLPTYSNIKFALRSSLGKLLGRSHDLAYVASIIDNSIVLPMPIKNHTTHRYEDPQVFEADKAFAQENFGVNLRAYQKLMPYTESRELLYQKIRTVYPDFAFNMEQKIPADDYLLYADQVRLMRDLLNDPVIDKDVSLKENLLRMQDRHAEVIDTIDFSRACSIEDRFIISELEKFFELLKDAPKATVDALNKADIPVYAQLPGNEKLHRGKFSTVHYANLCMGNRKSRLRKYDEISLLYKKLDAHPEIKLKLDDSYEEEK